MTRSILGLALLVSISHQAYAGPALSFTHNFDMRGNYTEYLHSVTNAFVNNESPSFPDVYYWAPTQTNTWAEIVYRYDLGFRIDQASLYANMHSFYVNLDPGSRAYLDVSADGLNWTTVAERYVENRNPVPIDISDILRGSSTAYVRGRLFETRNFGSIHYAQFLRTTSDPELQSPNVYQFQAIAAVPEPSNFALAMIGGAVCGVVVLRQRLRVS